MNLPQIIFSAMAALITLTLHEFAHGYVAYKLGDNTARSLGRLSLNPLKHLDPFGALCMIFFHFGWAKPVPINPRNFKNPRKGFAITALAGPLTNLVTGFFTIFIYLLCLKLLPQSSNSLVNNIYSNVLLFLWCFFSINIGLGVFNLIPIPPFDGSRIVNVLLPEKWYFKIMKYERQIYWGVIAWLLLGRYVYYAIASIPFVADNYILLQLFKIFSLSDILNDAITAIANGMIKFWTLFPFLR